VEVNLLEGEGIPLLDALCLHNVIALFEEAIICRIISGGC
jgi:hypothetical protein